MISEDELRHMYWDEGMSQIEIANEIGVSDVTISNWMSKYGIVPRTISESMLAGTQKPFKKELEVMYWNQGMSRFEISIDIGVSLTTVNRWMKEYGIKSRTNSEARLNGDFTGEKSGGWRGGISGGRYCYKFNRTFKEAVRERDDYTCQLCGYEQLLGGRRLSVHHIHYDKENCYPNVVTLCSSCNSKVNSDRDYWEQYFENQLLGRGLLEWSISA